MEPPLETFVVVTVGREAFWHLDGRGQGRCWTSQDAQARLSQQRAAGSVHRGEVETRCEGLPLQVCLCQAPRPMR